MAITTGQASVGTVPTLIDGTFNSNFRLILHNIDNTDAIYIGNSDVTVLTGLPLLKQETIQLELNPLERIYAVSAKTGHPLAYLKQV